MEPKELKLVSERSECLHSSLMVAGPDGLRTYGLPVDRDDCLECAWRDFDQSCGKNIELPALQLFWWPHSPERPAHWVAEVMPIDLLPGVSSIVGRGKTPGSALFDVAAQIRTFLKDQHQ